MANVLITGCSTGIGRATAIELAGRGHQVVATARRVETLEDLDVAAKVHLDVTDEQSVLDAMGAVGEIDALVNNAGWEVSGPVELVPLHELREMWEVNYFGAVRTIQAVAPRMRLRGHGVIVNVSSVAGRAAGPLNGFYAGTKHALEALSDAMHYELGHFGIRTVVVEPGAIATHFSANILHVGTGAPPYDELRAQWDQASTRLRTGEPPGPEVVARVIADAIEDPTSARRIPVGEDAELVLDAHKRLDDVAFEAAMRDALGIDW